MPTWGSVTVPEITASGKVGSTTPLVLDSRAAGTSAAGPALLKLRAELRLLDRRITKLHAHDPEATKVNTDTKQQQRELGKTIGCLEADVGALREAALIRFESTEGRLATLETDSEAHSKSLSGTKRKLMESDPNSRAAKRARRRSGRSITPDGAKPPRRARLRSSSPAPPASALSLPLETSTPKILNGRFIVPTWAAQVNLQSQPLPEGREFASVLEAIKQAREQAPDDELVSITAVASCLREVDPGFFARHTGMWRFLIPVCQQYVAFIVVLPPLQRNLKECTEQILLVDPARPYFSHRVSPPSFMRQLKESCKQANIHVKTWNERYAAVPMSYTPEPLWLGEAAVASVPLSGSTTSQLPLSKWEHPVALMPKWNVRLSKPTCYHALVDILRREVTVDFQVEIAATLATLRLEEGSLRYDEMLKACGSTEHFLSMAARYIKIEKGAGQTLNFRDPLYPYHKEEHNKEYFRVRATEPGPAWLHNKLWPA